MAMMLMPRRFQCLADGVRRLLLANHVKGITSQCTPTTATSSSQSSSAVSALPAHMELQRTWPTVDRAHLVRDMLVLEDFLSADEEEAILKEVDPYMQRLRYEFDHWDDAIHGFRETERQHWYPHNKAVLERVAQTAFDGHVMPYIHVLDLADSGVIKAHVDSSRYCGSTIAGLSLLSDCVMRLVRTDETRYTQPTEGGPAAEEYRNMPKDDAAVQENGPHYVDVLLRRRSLYIMKDTARYNFTHEILANERSLFKGALVPKTRRLSVICRNKP